MQLGDLGAPATKGDILGLLKHLRTWFRTHIALLCEEVTAITDRVKAKEEDISSIAQSLSDAMERMKQLQGSHQALKTRVDAMEDARRCTNIKVRGIAKSINDTELPHFIRRLMSEILHPKQVKILQLEGTGGRSPRRPPSIPVPPRQTSSDGCHQEQVPVPV
ncbi:Hypothetical predicted protein [Pelobates cultripes]|uniref:Uncharacterized protein n=1 Tax=Pelobates cultripes TaxID=61616 RepID=A0AAD1W6W0_PELCU|nr:Hypothetical predicted protein [Pelobates cultripes]